MSTVVAVLDAFSRAISLLSRRRVAVPLLLYFLLKLGITLLYVASDSVSLNRAWALLARGPSAEELSHYPEHLLYMTSVLGRIDMPLEVLVLVLAQGATVLLVAGALRGENPTLGASLRGAAARYLHLALAAAATAAALYACFVLVPMLMGAHAGAGGRPLLLGSTLLGLVVQTLFVYAIPFILLEGKSAPGAIGASFRLAARAAADSFLLVFLPFLITIPTMLASLKPELIAFRLSPELLIHLQIAGEIMQLIATYLLIGGVTVFFIRARGRTEETR